MSALTVAGPTAAGKTSLAVDLALAFDAVVLSADAMQVYRGMDVGTGKATAAEQRGVPHLGLDVVDPDEPFDAADFLALAERVCAEHPRVVICGGTSLYLRTFQRGLVRTPPVDPALRAELSALPDLHGRLLAVDPALAARLEPADTVRILRGLEVHAATGERLSELQAAHAAQPDRNPLVGVWLDRDDLDARIDARVAQMVVDGVVDETRRLLDRFDRGVKPLRSLGYRHLVDHVLDGLELDEAVRRTQRDSRRFARKQRTWRKQLGLVPGDVFALARQRWG